MHNELCWRNIAIFKGSFVLYCFYFIAAAAASFVSVATVQIYNEDATWTETVEQEKQPKQLKFMLIELHSRKSIKGK